MKTTLNFSQWLERLGVKDGRQPEVLRSVQPVQVVGDASSLVAPVLAPMAWAGGSSAAGIGEHGFLQIRSLAPGGSVIRSLRASSVINGSWAWRLTATPTVLSVSAVAINQDMAPEATVSTVNVGRVLAANILNSIVNPTLFAGQRVAMLLVDEVYLPHGQFLEVCASGANDLSKFAVMFEDLPAPLTLP